MKDKGNNRIDESSQIDDLFRQGLKNLRAEPSRDLWKGINRNLWWDEISHFTFTNLSKFLLIGGIAGIMTVITALMIVVVPQPNNSHVTSSSIFSNQLTASNSLMIPVRSISYQKDIFSISRTHGGQIKAEIPNGNITQTKISPAIDPEKELLADSYTSPEPLYFSNTTISSSSQIVHETDQGFPSFMEPIGNENSLAEITDNTMMITPSMIQNPVTNNPPISRFFSVDMGVSPEVTFNGANSSGSQWDFSGDIGFSYHIGIFSIRSGIGISYIADDGIYQIDYRSKDSVGYFNQVVSFAINLQDPSKITYMTQCVVVYDSIQHIADDRKSNRYTYLQIPIFAGFRVLETNRLGLTVHAGPMVSFLIGKKEAQPVIDYPNARIIRIDNNTPVRVSTNWQLFLGLRLDYKISNEFSLYAEPYYKYYFKPVFEQKEAPAANPYSIGCGIGIQYNFGSKTHKP